MQRCRVPDLPEDGVVDMTATIELEGAVQSHHAADVILRHCVLQLLLRQVQVSHVGGVVLPVMQLHDLLQHYV